MAFLDKSYLAAFLALWRSCAVCLLLPPVEGIIVSAAVSSLHAGLVGLRQKRLKQQSRQLLWHC
jgi:hypothetical protein